MNEMELLVRLRDDIPCQPVPDRPAAVLRRAIQTEQGRPRRRTPGLWGRTWRPALAATMALTLAVGLQVGRSFWSARSLSISVSWLTGQAASAAEVAEPVRPGQWVFRMIKLTGCLDSGAYSGWSTARATKQATLSRGRVQSLSGAFLDGVAPVGSATSQPGQAIVSVASPGPNPCQRLPMLVVQSGGLIVTSWGRLPLSGPSGARWALRYSTARALPARPAALDRQLESLQLTRTSLGAGAYQAFYLIQGMLATYVLPPAKTAELYQALACLPGVSVEQHVRDPAGRAGTALTMTVSRASALTQKIIIDPRTYQLMGFELASPTSVVAGSAILRQAVVLKAGDRA
jgi:hypothetical protein